MARSVQFTGEAGDRAGDRGGWLPTATKVAITPWIQAPKGLFGVM